MFLALLGFSTEGILGKGLVNKEDEEQLPYICNMSGKASSEFKFSFLPSFFVLLPLDVDYRFLVNLHAVENAGFVE